MAASISGALKALIEAAGLSLTVARDDFGEGTPTGRYVTVSEAVSVTTDRLGDIGSDDPVTELVQVDLWQPWRAAVPGDPAESYGLADDLHQVLHGARLTAAPMNVRSCTVDGVQRLVERDSNTVHHAFTLRLKRDR